ncbi:hypothetical protein LUZ60_003472 [Juncus effusus]|nr:hypothetical protein LUZ60_003472 [Juncus effusus]
MGSISVQTEERACYNEGMQFMSMNGQLKLFRNLTIVFLSKETHQSIRKFPELTDYINTNINVDSRTQEGGLHINALLPHLLMVIVLVVVVSRVLHFLLRYIKQPLIICQMIAGIIIFSFVNRPSADNLLMRSVDSTMLLDPTKRRVQDVIGSTGIVFNLFIIGVKMDVGSFWRAGKKKPLLIGLSSLLIPLALTLSISFLLFDRLNNGHLLMIVLAVFAVALSCDLLGTVYTDGPVIMGLTLPNGPPLGKALIERVDLVASELFLPIIFMKEGHNFNWEGLKQNLILWFWLEVIVLVAFVTRIVVTVVAAVYCCGMSVKNGLLLGLIMNFRGLIEMLTFIRFVNIEVIDKTTFTMLVLSTIPIAVLCAPLVSIYYKPLGPKKQMGRRTVQGLSTDAELRVMTCFYDDKPVPALLDFLEAASPEFSSICIHALKLVELQACASASLISHRNQKGFINLAQMDPAHNRFLTFQQIKRGVAVLPYTSIAPLRTIHQDVCALVLERNIAFVIVPFPKANSIAGLEANTAMHNLVPMVLQEAQCSVGILVYNGITRLPMPIHSKYHVGVIFWGGPDDREAISIACRIARHSKVRLDILRFFSSSDIDGCQQEDIAGEVALDDMKISKLQVDNTGNNRVAVSEIRIENLEQLVLVIHNLAYHKYDLLIVGRGQMNSSRLSVCEGLHEWTDSPELGVIGDILATDFSGTANVLVVQQHGSD